MLTYAFTAANGSPLPALLNAAAGDFQIQGNRLFAAGLGPNWIFTTRYGNQVGLELSDGTNSVVFNGEAETTGKAGLVFRFSDINNYWYAYLDLNSGVNEELFLHKVVAGVDTQVANANIPGFMDNENITITSTPSGDTINIFVDGILRINVTDSFNQTAIKAGGYFSRVGPSLDSLTVATPVNTAPVADAGVEQNVSAGQQVTLDATGSSDIDGDILSYVWEQTSGTPVTLSNSNVAQPFFEAPSLLSPSVLTFQVTVSDGQAQDTASVTVNVAAFVLPVGDTVDELQRQFIVETGADKLKRIGATHVLSSAGVKGNSPIIPVTYPTEEWKVAQRYEATQENPDDENGLGMQFTNVNNSEV